MSRKNVDVHVTGVRRGPRLRRRPVRLLLIAWLAVPLVACSSRSAPPDVSPPRPVPEAPPVVPAPAAPPAAPPLPPARPELPPPTVPEPTPPVAPPRADDVVADCSVVPGPGEPIASVALGERVDPSNAPHPTNDSERFLFRQLYETLLSVDCTGRPRAGLAASWRLDADGRTWIVTLRENAGFADGQPVTTADVLASWTVGGVGALRPQVLRSVQSVVPLDDRTLAITLRNEGLTTPLALADVDLAIAKRVPGLPWPSGTRGVRIAGVQPSSSSGRSVITVTGVAGGDGAWSVRFVVAPDRDRRDFLDEGVDLLLTRDPATLDYAATLPQWLSAPLAWGQTRVFVSRWRGPSLPPLSATARQTLADDAVRGEARGADGPSWWEGVANCGLEIPATAIPASPAARIVYEREDSASRDLAERFVGLAGLAGTSRGQAQEQAAALLDALVPSAQRRSFQRAIGLTGDALAQAQSRGNDAGYILSLDRAVLDPCHELRALVDRIGWFDPGAIVPLVDTRLRAIVRRGRSGLTAEWDGGLLLTRGGSAR